jgi:hypothetical protein
MREGMGKIPLAHALFFAVLAHIRHINARRAFYAIMPRA